MFNFNNTQLLNSSKPDLQLDPEQSKLFIQYLLNCLANVQPQQQNFQPEKQQQLNGSNQTNDQIGLNMNLNHLNMNFNNLNKSFNNLSLSGRKLTGNRSILNGMNFENSATNSSVNSSVNSPRTTSNSSVNDIDLAFNSSDYDSDLSTRSKIYPAANQIQVETKLADQNSNQRTNAFNTNEMHQRSATFGSFNMNRTRQIRNHFKQSNSRSNYKSSNYAQQPNPRLNAKQQKVFKEILKEIEIKKNQQYIMSKYGGKIKYEFKYIVDHDGLLPKGTSSFRMRIPNNSSCSFCANNNLPEEFAKSHILKDPNNLILCPMLQCYECPICRSTGVHSHTVRYCQMNRQLALERAKIILNMMHPNDQVNQNDGATMAC